MTDGGRRKATREGFDWPAAYARLEGARKAGRIGKGLDAVVYIVTAPEEQWLPLLQGKGGALLAALFNVSGVRVKEAPPAGAGLAYDSQDIPGLLVTIVPAQGLGWKKCARCWMWSGRVGEDALHPTLCERCAPIVRSLST